MTADSAHADHPAIGLPRRPLFFVIAARELYERRMAVAAAALLGLITIPLAFLPGVDQTTRHASGLACAVVFGWGGALITGFNLFGRDLANGRIRFDLARPGGALPGVLGRAFGALVLLLACQLVALIPHACAFPIVRSELFAQPERLMRVETITWVIFVAACGLGIIARDRSRPLWLAFDVLVLALAWALIVIGHRTWHIRFTAFTTAAEAAVAFAFLVFGLTGARGQLRSAHRRMASSIALVALTSAARSAGSSERGLGRQGVVRGAVASGLPP